MGGIHYATDAHGAVGCYRDHGHDALLILPEAKTGDTVLLGSPDIFYNNRLDQHGNASLALQLLGSRPHLVWYLPSLDDPSAAETGSGRPDDDTGGQAGGESDFIGLIPSGLALGHPPTRPRRRARRRLARPPLRPSGHRAATGRHPCIRIHRRTGPPLPQGRRQRPRRRHPALRDTSPHLPPPRVSPRDADAPDVLLPAVAARLSPSGTDLGALLFGPAPADDAALLLLTDQLDALEREVRTS